MVFPVCALINDMPFYIGIDMRVIDFTRASHWYARFHMDTYAYNAPLRVHAFH